MAPYVSGRRVTLVGGAHAWWHNWPVSVLSRTGNAIPKNADLVITTTLEASHDEKMEARTLANAANDKRESSPSLRSPNP